MILRRDRSDTNPRARRRVTHLSASLCVLVALVMAAVHHRDLIAILVPPPEPWSDSRHYEPTMRWMKESLPAYVVAASSHNRADRLPAGERFVGVFGLHPGLATRARALVDAVEAWHEISDDPLLTWRTDLEEATQRIDQRAASIEGLLREIDAPFSITHETRVMKDGARRRLLLVITSLEVLQKTRFEADQTSYFTLRVRRLDNLNIVDRLHGETQNGRAIVMEDSAVTLINDRYLPALSSRSPPRSFLEAATNQGAITPDQIATWNALASILPADLRAHAEEIADLATERRAVLEQLARLTADFGLELRSPPSLMFRQEWLRQIETWLGARRYPELLRELERLSEVGSIPLKQRDRLLSARDSLLDHFLRGVERHEAWHLMSPSPSAPEELPPLARAEAIAYLGALADAGDELALVWDQLIASFERMQSTGPTSATDLAIAWIVRETRAAASAVDRTDPLAAIKSSARQVLEARCAETRSLRWIDQTRYPRGDAPPHHSTKGR